MPLAVAFIFIVYVPTCVVDEVSIFKLGLQVGRVAGTQEEGEKLHDTPAGKFVQLKVTEFTLPEISNALTFVLIEFPLITDSDTSKKSFLVDVELVVEPEDDVDDVTAVRLLGST